MAGAAAIIGTTFIVEHQISGYTSSQTAQFPDVNPLDARLNPDLNSKNWKLFSDALLFSEVLAQNVIFLKSTEKGNRKAFYGVLVEGYLINQAITDVVKLVVQRPRPYAYNSNSGYDISNSDARLSFYSGHTANAAFFGSLISIILYKYEAVPARWAWVPAVVFPAIMGASRMMAGKHFFTDVLAGTVAGAGVGLLTFRLHHKTK